MSSAQDLSPFPPPAPPMRSCLCTQAQFETPWFRWWLAKLDLPFHLHRKPWEFCFVAQTLYEHGMLTPGKRGLGFAVGQEPMPALFASFGCDIVATDLDPEKAGLEWVATNQNSSSIEQLQRPSICSPDVLRQRVTFREADMNDIDKDLTGFDFVWSCCSFEHLGSIKKGKKFIQRMIRCLRPGGLAVHTTEYNVGSNVETVDNTMAVIYRRSDLEEMKKGLERNGHSVVPFDFDSGNLPADLHVDEPPYEQKIHLKLRLGGFVTTSAGIISRAGERQGLWERFWPWRKSA